MGVVDSFDLANIEFATHCWVGLCARGDHGFSCAGLQPSTRTKVQCDASKPYVTKCVMRIHCVGCQCSRLLFAILCDNILIYNNKKSNFNLRKELAYPLLFLSDKTNCMNEDF